MSTRMHSNHVHTILSGQAMLEESLPPRPPSLPARSVGYNVTGKTQVHRHRRCRCQVCRGGNCQCCRPAARGLERESLRENEEQPLVEFVCLRGQLNIWRCCLSDSPLPPRTTLYSSYSFTLCLFRPAPLVLLALVHVHFQFSPFFCLLSNCSLLLSFSPLSISYSRSPPDPTKL